MKTIMNTTSRRVRSSQIALIAMGIATLSIPSYAAPTPQEILAKSAAAMKNLKTYQATIQMNMANGPMGAMSINMDIKKSGASKMWMKMVMNMAGAKQAPQMLSAFNNIQVVDDGKNAWTYMPGMKQYSKGPSGSAKNMFNLDQLLSQSGKESTMKLVGTENLAGKPAYVLQAVPKKAGQNDKVLLYFDQATYRFRQMKASGSTPAMQGRPAMQQNMTIQVKNEIVNEPISDSLFKFTPPPGSTEAKGGMGMGMGGMMGGGSRR